METSAASRKQCSNSSNDESKVIQSPRETIRARLLRHALANLLLRCAERQEDVRMVYDGTKSGLNSCIWVPRFPLPTVGTYLRAVEAGTFMGDMDVGEMFLNFVLHESMQALCGIDLT